MDGFLDSLLVGLFGGLANLLIDIPALWNHDWSRGIPSYIQLIQSPHRYLHTPLFCLGISYLAWLFLTTLVHGFIKKSYKS